jgi:BirA family biotin operon repressor/biotin-[acetyl-CoA-carboxylase] ligase
VPLVAGVALVDVIERESPAARLWVKWPNDVYLGDHKVSGVLTELVEPATMVVGIGVNVSHAVAELPLPTATSLSIHGINFEPEALAEQWVQHFFALLDTLGTEELLDHVRRRLGLVGEQVTVNMPDNSVIEGTVIELEATGALTVDDGKLRHTVLAGDVRTLRPRT